MSEMTVNELSYQNRFRFAANANIMQQIVNR